jgi:hypothetical protein
MTHPIGNVRLKAARQHAGYASQQALADAPTRAAPQRGLGHLEISDRQIRRWESANRHGREPTTSGSWSMCSSSRLKTSASPRRGTYPWPDPTPHPPSAILAHAAFVPGWAARQDEYADRMRAARTYARRAPASAEFLAWLDAVEAECETISGHPREALRLIEHAESILAAGGEHASPDWFTWFSPRADSGPRAVRRRTR